MGAEKEKSGSASVIPGEAGPLTWNLMPVQCGVIVKGQHRVQKSGPGQVRDSGSSLASTTLNNPWT